MLFEKTTIHVLVAAFGSVEQLICVPLTPWVGDNLDISPTLFKLSTKCQTVEHLNICDKISHTPSQQLMQQEKFMSM